MKIIKRLVPFTVGIALLTVPYTHNNLKKIYQQTKNVIVEEYENTISKFQVKPTEINWEEKIDREVNEIKKAALEDALSNEEILTGYGLSLDEVRMYFTLKKYKKKIEKYAEVLKSKELVPYYLALLYGESSGRPFVKSKHNAYGLFQIKYEGAFSWAWEFLNNQKEMKKYPEIANLLSDFKGSKKEVWEKVKTNPDMNIRLGMAYLYFCFKKDNDISEALKDYGVGTLGKKQNPEIAEKYVIYIENIEDRISDLFEKIEEVRKREERYLEDIILPQIREELENEREEKMYEVYSKIWGVKEKK